MVAKINTTKCNGCGICLYRCGTYALEFDVNHYKAHLARPKDCIDCFFCMHSCPENAIDIIIPEVEHFLKQQKSNKT